MDLFFLYAIYSYISLILYGTDFFNRIKSIIIHKIQLSKISLYYLLLVDGFIILMNLTLNLNTKNQW